MVYILAKLYAVSNQSDGSIYKEKQMTYNEDCIKEFKINQSHAKANSYNWNYHAEINGCLRRESIYPDLSCPDKFQLSIFSRISAVFCVPWALGLLVYSQLKIQLH